jgi:hypothetical protein
MPQLPCNIEVISTGERVRYRLPRESFGTRDWLFGLGLCGVGALVVGVVVRMAYLALADLGIGLWQLPFLLGMLGPLSVGVFFFLIGLWPFFGRDEVELTPQRLRRISRIGPFSLSRRRSRSHFRRLSVTESKDAAGDCELKAEYDAGKPLVLATGPRKVLATLADDLGKRIGQMQAAPEPLEDKAKLYRTPAGVTIRIPAVGMVRGVGAGCLIWTSLFSLLAFGAWYAALSGGQLNIGLAIFLLIPTFPFLLSLISLVLGWRAGRQVELTVGDGVLAIRQRGFFGMREEQWSAGELAEVRVAPELEIGSRHQARFEVVPKQGTTRAFLPYRDENELNRIAKIVQDELAIDAECAAWLPRSSVEVDGQEVGGESTQRSHGAPVTLKPDRPPAIVGLVVFSILALGWYGFLALVYFQSEEDSGSLSPLLLFAGIGLFFIYHMVHSFLALFSPRPIISLNSAAISLGDTVELNWRFTRNAAAIRSLDIRLSGDEIAKVRCSGQGKPQSVCETFVDLPIVESTSNLQSGKSQMTVPLKSMHSFSAGDNQIAWSVDVSADVWFFPDVAVSFPIVVRPQPIKMDAQTDERTGN